MGTDKTNMTTGETAENLTKECMPTGWLSGNLNWVSAYISPEFGLKERNRVLTERDTDLLIGRAGEYTGKLFHIAIQDVKVYNERTVVVEFKDGKSEKAVTDPDDVFSLETGIMICIMKKILGSSTAYNKVIEYALKVKKRNEDLEMAKAKEKEMAEAKRVKIEEKKKRRAERKREEAIQIQKEAYLRALTEYNMIVEDECK